MSSSYAAAIRARRDLLRETLARLYERDGSLSASLVDAALVLEAAQTAVDALQQEHQALRDQCEVFEQSLATLPPEFDPQIMRRLPTELLCAIFREVVFRPDAGWLAPIAADLGRVAAPFVCAFVCRRWRAVALTTPSLWSYIAVPGLSPHRPNQAVFHLRRVRLLLERSKSHPLFVVLDWADGCSWSKEPKFASIIAALAPHLHRYKSFDFAMPSGVTLKQVEHLRNPAPLLQRTRLDSADDAMLPFPGSRPHYLPDSPLLREFTSGTIFLTPLQPMLNLVNADFFVHDHPPADLWAALHMMPALQDLRIHFLENGLPEPEPPATPLTLPALRHLSIGRDPRVAASWASALHLPALESMTLSGACVYSRAFRDFCLAVCSGVRELEMDNAPMDGAEPAHPLPLHAVFPRTRKVTVVGVLDPPALAYLGDAALWPHLDTLDLERCWLRGDAADALVRFARDKCRRSSDSEPPVRIALRECSVVSWLPTHLALAMGGDRDLSITGTTPWSEQDEIRDIAVALDEQDSDGLF